MKDRKKAHILLSLNLSTLSYLDISVVATKGKSYFVNVGVFCVGVGFTTNQLPIEEVLPNVYRLTNPENRRS